MSFFTTENYSNSYQPKVSLPESEVKPPKCGSADDKTNIELLNELYNENAKLCKELKKVRKEKKRWKRKYLELRDRKKSIELARIEDGLGLEPILYDKDGESRKFGIRYERRG